MEDIELINTLGIPFVIAITAAGLIYGQANLKRQPLAGFLFISCLIALLFFAGWAIYWGWLPQFSEVGIIG